MTEPPSPRITTAGPAFRVTLLTPQVAQSYAGVYAQVDAERGVVHVLSADATVHHLTVPLGWALIEWQDAAALQPRPYLPSYGPDSFAAMGEQMNEMMERMQQGFNRG